MKFPVYVDQILTVMRDAAGLPWDNIPNRDDAVRLHAWLDPLVFEPVKLVFKCLDSFYTQDFFDVFVDGTQGSEDAGIRAWYVVLVSMSDLNEDPELHSMFFEAVRKL